MGRRIHPFSNGSEFGGWTDRNCRGGCKRYTEPTPTCPLEIALVAAYCRDGTITEGIARRLGCFTTELQYPSRRCPEFLAFETRKP